MLKRNLVRTGLFSHGMLLLIPSKSTIESESFYSFRKIKTPVEWKIPDTLQTPAGDSASLFLSQLTEEELAQMPKISLNKNVTKFVNSFLVKENEALQKAKAKGASYFQTIEDIFRKYGLPTELKYLAVVESYLKTNAVSKAGAKGMWQLMPTTARELGLKVNGKYDERTHFYKSTVAAAKYLKDLHKEFDDWLLVIAAYNGGPGTVYNAIKKSGSKNFWALQNFLPMESRAHVKRYIGTHYFFEGKGGLTTMTKPETIKYNKAMDDFKMTIRSKEHTDTLKVVAGSMR
jgi:membrane-bound lytic murein transglycosylase D